MMKFPEAKAEMQAGMELKLDSGSLEGMVVEMEERIPDSSLTPICIYALWAGGQVF